MQPSASVTVAVCQPAPESIASKFVSSLPSVALSVVALLLSWKTFAYNQEKDRRARKQSIQDDFWLRKVVSPVSIEPFLEHINELCARLPSVGATTEEANAFWSKEVLELGRFEVAFQTLALIDRQLLEDVLKKFEYLHDRLADYNGELRAYIDTPTAPTPDREGTTRYLLSCSMELLGLIKAHQTRVWSDG